MNAGDCCPMQRAWETLLAQARTNHKAQENIADLVQAHRDAIQVQRELAQAQREVVQVNRVMAEATLLTMRGAQGCYELPCQDDEPQEGGGGCAQGGNRERSSPHPCSPRQVAGATSPVGSARPGFGKAHTAGGPGQGLGSDGVHAEVQPVVQGTSGGDIGNGSEHSTDEGWRTLL